MIVDLGGVKTWIPEVDTPCRVTPDLFTEGKSYNWGPIQNNLKKVCMGECPLLEECWTNVMEQERGMSRQERIRQGFRAAMTPFQRYKIANPARH